MAFAPVAQKSSTSSIGRATVRSCRVARSPVVVKASKKNNVEAAMQAVGTQAVTAALAVAMCVMAPSPAQALLPFKQSYQNQLDNAASSVQNKVQSDIDNTKGKGFELKSAVENKLGNPVESVNSAAKSTFNKVKANLPLGNLPDVGGKVKSDLNNASSKGQDLKSKVDNKLGNPVDAIGAKANSTLDKIKSVVPIATLPDFGNKVAGKVQSDIDNTKGKGYEVKSAVDNKLGNPADSVGDAAKSTFNKIKANLPLGTLPDVQGKVQSDINNTQNKASELKGAVQNQVQGSGPADALGDAANAAKGAFDNLKSGLPLGNIGSGNGNGTGEGVAAGKAKEQQVQADAATSGQKVKDFVLGTSYGKQ